MRRPPEPTTDDHFVRRALVPLGCLWALTVAIYHPVVGFGLIEAWDDSLYFTQRAEVLDWFGASWEARLLTPELGYPVPLPTFMHFLVRQLPEAWIVAGAHGLSLGVHLVNVGLAYLLAKRWLGAWPALAACALWAGHPLLVETVAWITNLKVLCLATCSLGGLLAWQRHCEQPSASMQAVALGCVVGALTCRPEGVVLPAIYAALTARQRGWRALLRARASAAIWAASALALAYAPLAVVGQGEVLAATAPDLSAAERLQRMGAALAIQIEHTVRPFDLHPAYYPDYDGVASDALLGAAAAVALGLLSLHAWRRQHAAGLGLLICLAFYAPASGISVLPRFTADTYMYLPLWGACVATVALTHRMLRDVKPSIVKLSASSTLVLVVGLALASWVQSARWQDAVTLWEPVIEAAPTQAQPYWIVAQTQAARGESTAALQTFEAGGQAFYLRRRIPLGWAEALLDAGQPQRAAEVAAGVITRSELSAPNAPLFFAWVVSTKPVTLPDQEHIQQSWEVAARRIIANPPPWRQDVLQRFADRLAARGMHDLAQQVRRAIEGL